MTDLLLFKKATPSLASPPPSQAIFQSVWLSVDSSAPGISNDRSSPLKMREGAFFRNRGVLYMLLYFTSPPPLWGPGQRHADFPARTPHCQSGSPGVCN